MWDVCAIIRPAQARELPLIQDLLLRSKASWGYDESFMAAARDDLTLPPDDLQTTQTYVCAVGDRVAGFYGLRVKGDEAELVDLFAAIWIVGHPASCHHLQHFVRRSFDHVL